MKAKSIERIAEELGVNFHKLRPYILMREEIAFKAGEDKGKQEGREEEYKRWIKFAMMAGICLDQPQQLKRIIPQISGMYQREYDLIQAGSIAQDIKTHKETLKAVGRYLSCCETRGGEGEMTLDRIIKSLLRGEMPEEAK